MPLGIPSDHLIDPRIGHLGWRSPSFPQGWEADHRRAEAGGYFRIGRQWTRLADEDSGAALRLVGMPTAVLYQMLLERVTLVGAAYMGYTVDA